MNEPIPITEAIEAVKQVSASNLRVMVECLDCKYKFGVRKKAAWANCPKCMKLIEVRP